jgi:hypothetical protein
MLEADNFIVAGNAIRAASALTETTFLQVGKTLEASIEILARLTESFDTLLTELKSEHLRQALQSLAQAAARVAELGRTQPGESAGFDRLQRLAEAITRRILKMHGSVKTVASLSISSKIATTDIRTSTIDFSTFADQIARTLDMTRSSLDSFAAELLPVHERVVAARATQLTFEKRQDEAARSIPPRLLATVASIHQQHRHAARASAAVRGRSDGARQQICNAIMALQIGDITRQRLEHTDCALGLISGSQEAPLEMRQHEAGSDVGLDADERYAFRTTTCRLLSAQLLDAAQAFDRDVRQVIASLNSLAAEARALRNLGSAAYGSSDRGHDTFIAELEAQVAEALQLLAAFGTAQAEASGVAESVSNATEGLCGHLATVQSLEADIRIMSLNTTLKCSRAGREGLALSLIAQELRSYANEFAREAGALMGEVENITEIAGSLSRGRDAGAAPVVAEVMRAMQDSLATLRQEGQTLGDALANLERDSDRVVALLVETVGNLANHDEIGQALRQAATALAAISAQQTFPPADLSPRVEQMLNLMASNYTMAIERRVHDEALGRPDQASGGPATVVNAELEDVLF